MFKVKTLSANRRIIINMLKRSMSHHAPITGVFHWDVTDTLNRIEEERAKGRDVGLAAYMVKATALTMRSHPKLNQRLIRRWYGLRIVQWEEVSCNLVVERTNQAGEKIIVPMVIRHVDKMSVEDIHRMIRHYKSTDIKELPEFSNRNKAKKVPHWVLSWIDKWLSNHPKAFIRQFGTYNLSSIIHSNSGGVAGAAIGPSTTFYPTNIEDRPHVHDSQISIRKVMAIGVLVDHCVVDGMASLQAVNQLKPLIENPDLILGPVQTDVT